MRRLIYAILIVALLATPTISYAKEDEPVTPWPKWATERCINTISRIIQHEAGGTKDDEIFQFMAEQVIRDVELMGCEHLTSWRWAIGNYYPKHVLPEIRLSVLTTLARYPETKFVRCRFIGMRADLKVWASHGYDTTIGFEKTVNKLTVIGVGCETHQLESRQDSPSVNRTVRGLGGMRGIEP